MRGRNGSDPVSEPDSERRRLLVWLWRLPVIAALAGGGYSAWRAIQVQFGKAVPTEEPTFTTLEPVPIEELQAFDEEWAHANFVAGTTPAVAIRLPERTPASLTVDGNQYAAFSRICTHQGCLVDLNTSVEAIALATNYRPENPALICPCHLSVFLPLESGRAVSGPAVEPLPRVALAVKDRRLYAVGIEKRG